jgi:hypothetical protein
MSARSLPRASLLVAASCMATGCSPAGAPSFALFGAFFPAWMVCALIGIIGAVAARLVLSTPLLGELIPFQLAVCTAVGTIVGLLAWAALFR